MKTVHVLAAMMVAFCWGANFTAVKIGLEHFPPYLMLALRFALVAAILLTFYPKRTSPLAFVLKLAFVLGTVHFALMFGGMAYGLDVPTAIITVQLGVPFSCLLSAIFFNDQLGPWRSFGLVIAFLGIMLIAGTPNVLANFFPFVMVMVGAFFWAMSNIMMKKQGVMNVLELLAWQSLFSVPMLLLVSLVFESNQWELVQTTTVPAALSILFSAIGSTVIAYGLWYWLLRECDVSRVAPFNLLVPFFGIAVERLFFIEPLSAQAAAGGLITLAGVAIIILRRPKLAELGKIVKAHPDENH